MATVTALEAKTRFGELLARVARGEEIVITKYDKPVARLIPEKAHDLAQVRQAVEDLRQLQQDMLDGGMEPLTVEEILSARDAGRR